MSKRPRVLRIVTVPLTFETILTGQIRFLNENGYEVMMASDTSNNIDALTTRENCPHFTINFRRKINLYQDFVALIQTYRLIQKLRPDVVHTQTPKAGLLGMAAAWLLGVPVRLHTVGGLPLLEKPLPFRLLLICTEWLTYVFATRVFVNSFELKSYMENNIYGSHSKFKIIGQGSTNGIDSDYFKRSDELEDLANKLRVKFGFADSDFVWIYVGRITRDKGITELVQAFLSLNQENQTTKLIILGGFDVESDFVLPKTEQIIKGHSCIQHIGFQADVRPYLVLADAFVFPSYREGLPNALMEAACIETPIVASDVMGCREVVQHEVSGLLVSPKNVSSLVQSMRRLQTNPALRRRLGQTARALVSTKYERQPLWQAILIAYQDAINYKI